MSEQPDQAVPTTETGSGSPGAAMIEPEVSSPSAPSPPGPAAPVPGPSAPGPERKPRRTSVVWVGAALVLVGGALLLDQFIPGLDLLRLWPLIIVALGIRQMFGPAHAKWTVKHAAEGLATVVFGLVLLGCAVGALSWNVWVGILRLWPVLLVAIGVEVIGHGLHNDWVRALSSLLVAGGLIYGALFMPESAFVWPPSGGAAGEVKPFTHSAPHNGAIESGTASIDAGVGEFSLSAGDKLATAEGESPLVPEFVVGTAGSKADVRIGYRGASFNKPWVGSSLDVTLDRHVTWTLDLNAGVSTYELDLSNLPVRSLTLDSGVSDGKVILSESSAVGLQGAIPVDIDAGVSSLVVRVPTGDNARVVVTHGLSDVRAKGSWVTMRGSGSTTYESDGFSDKEPYWDIAIKAGVGAIRIEYY